MISSSSSGGACLPSSSRVKHGSGPNPVASTFMPFGRYADVGSHKIISSHPCLRLHVGSSSTLYLNKGTLLGKDITHISQVWNVWDAESTQEFYEQILPYIHPQTLRPLMGICVPTVIGLYSVAGGRLSLTMELPHPVGWREADPEIPTELKEKVIVAYRNIHARNILHNDVKLENVLIGKDDQVTIVDFCKMAIDPEPADLALEMRAVKFILDYDGAKKAEYERLHRAESRMEKNLWRSGLRRAAKSKELADGVEPDEPPSQDEIDFPPFSRLCLIKWDSEVVSEGKTYCPGWRGRRFEVPEDMRSPPWPGVEDYVPPTPPFYQPVDFAALVKTAFGREPFSSHSQWMKHCHYFPCLWSPLPESTASGNRLSTRTSSSSTTSSRSSDYGDCDEHSSTSDTDPYKKDRSPAPAFARKRLCAEDFNRPDDYSRGNKRARGPKSLEILSEPEVDPSAWATRRVTGLDLPSPSSKSKGKERELPPPSASLWESSPSEVDLPAFADIRPNHWKSAGSATRRSTAKSSRRRAPALADSGESSPSLRASPRECYPRRKSEKKCSIVVKDGDGEDKTWFVSRETLRDIKGYLQVKKAAGAAIESRSGGEEGDILHSSLRVDRLLRSSSTRPTIKRTNGPEDTSEEIRIPKRRRSCPDVDSYVSLPRSG